MRMRARGGGRIINMGSIADHRAIAGNSAYAASKFGLRGLSLTLAEEGADCGVRVSLVSPGAVATAIWADRDGFDPTEMLQPRDVAETVLDIVRRPLSVRLDEVRLLPPKGVL
jgi:NADP-dependent 3-hydroxy acid dehydrogenase YdfG